MRNREEGSSVRFFWVRQYVRSWVYFGRARLFSFRANRNCALTLSPSRHQKGRNSRYRSISEKVQKKLHALNNGHSISRYLLFLPGRSGGRNATLLSIGGRVAKGWEACFCCFPPFKEDFSRKGLKIVSLTFFNYFILLYHTFAHVWRCLFIMLPE